MGIEMISFLQAVLLAGVPILVLAVATEYVWRKKKYHNEFTRKFLHITAGTYVAFWPWFLSWHNIQLLALGALIALVVSRQLNVFKSMHTARRHGAGEFLSAASVGILPLITHDRWVFAASILNLSLADGFAAVVGTRFGKGNTHHVFGQRKSVVGTVTFWAFAVAILAGYFALTQAGWSWPTLLWLPVIAAALEVVGVHGLDNLLVPLLVAIVLKLH